MSVPQKDSEGRQRIKIWTYSGLSGWFLTSLTSPTVANSFLSSASSIGLPEAESLSSTRSDPCDQRYEW